MNALFLFCLLLSGLIIWGYKSGYFKKFMNCYGDSIKQMVKEVTTPSIGIKSIKILTRSKILVELVKPSMNYTIVIKDYKGDFQIVERTPQYFVLSFTSAFYGIDISVFKTT